MQRIPKPVAGPGGRAMRAVLLAGAAVLLAGCMTTETATVVPVPADYRQRHPIVIKEGERTVEVFVGSNRGGLTPAQRADVLAFAQVWGNEATGGVIIDVPTGTRNSFAAEDAMREIRSILVASGIPDRAIAVRPSRLADARAVSPIRISYSKMVAEVGPCGMWPDDVGVSVDSPYRENQPTWNHGCSMQRNLAAMVAEPTDLVQPRGESPPSTTRRNNVLDKYRQGQPTATNYPKTNKAVITDIGNW
jgi:pilus assembly protein CpaD